MNLVLLFPDDFIEPDVRVRLTGRRHRHIFSVLNAKVGDELSVGLLNDRVGIGRVIMIDAASVDLEVELKGVPPMPLPMTLILALPRPQALKRMLICASTLGIKKIVILNCHRVEKSIWQSTTLHEASIRDHLILGLEQAKDTILPEVLLRKLFKIFVEDELPEMIKGTIPFVAHPGAIHACPVSVKQPVTFFIGPEGGFIDYEVEKLKRLGFTDVDLGERILKVESVLPYVAGKMF
jgi:16S rRNA (uracil1498-N3)-methyltransferase